MSEHNKNRQVLLANRPEGMPGRDAWHFVDTDIPTPQAHEVLIRNQFISLDPAMRGWMRDVRSYIAPVAIDEVMRAGTIGQVVSSNNPQFAVGDYVNGLGGVQDYYISDGKGLTKVDPRFAPLQRYLGTLGMPGLTAYFGLLKTGAPKAGETVVVSGAAGAVGTVVGQIAKIQGCRVIGIAGGAEKCQYLQDELGFDAAIDYRSETFEDDLKAATPDRVDVFFDNVGGDVLDAVLMRINMHGRIVVCGAISQYNEGKNVQGPKNYLQLLVNRARMEGIVVFDNAREYGSGVQQMATWIAEGKLKSKEHVIDGLESFPETLQMLFTGKNFGKLVLKIHNDQ